MNVPHRVGDRYRCFILIKPDLTYTGPYGQRSSWPTWRCGARIYRAGWRPL